jgi:hypothetical protein
VSNREHLQQVERQLGRKPKDLVSPVEFPSLLAHVWVAFCALSNSRSSGMGGVAAITFADIKNWLELTENILSPRDIEVIISLDQTYRKVAND